MALEPMVWALKHAPVRDTHERQVLTYMADAADADGCNSFQSLKTIAELMMVDQQTVRRRVQALESRGLIRKGDQRYPALLKIPAYKRPINYDLCIPFGFYGATIEAVNAERDRKGLDPLTPQNRPPLDPVPKKERGRKKRKDAKGGAESGAVTGADASAAPGAGQADAGEHADPESGPPISQTPPIYETPPDSQTPPVFESGGGVSDREGKGYLLDSQTTPSNHPEEPPRSDGALPLDLAGDSGDTSPAGEAAPKAKNKRGTRIPRPWVVTPEMAIWAQTRCPDVDHRVEDEKFENYWLGRSGAAGVKLDWVATWRKWFITEQQRIEQRRAAEAQRQGKPFRSTDVWGAPPEQPEAIPSPPEDEGFFEVDQA